MPRTIGFGGFPAVLSRQIPGKALRAFGACSEFLPESPAVLGVWPKRIAISRRSHAADVCINPISCGDVA